MPMLKTILFAEMGLNEIKECIKEKKVVLIPTGSTEIHGPHLPIGTDIMSAYEISKKVAGKSDAIVAPPLNYGATELNKVIPGTISLKPETFIETTFEICSSLAFQGFDRLIIINGHGLNTAAVQVVGQKVPQETEALCATLDYFSFIEDTIQSLCETKTEAHAGEFETSVILYLNPQLVQMDKAVTEMNFPETKYSWICLKRGLSPAQIEIPWHEACPETKSAVVGDPNKATTEKGKKLVETAVDRIAEFVNEFKDFHRI